jgi:hypothetical protein
MKSTCSIGTGSLAKGTFSPQGSASEVEDYQVQLENLTILELTLKPDLTPDYTFATLSRCRVA